MPRAKFAFFVHSAPFVEVSGLSSAAGQALPTWAGSDARNVENSTLSASYKWTHAGMSGCFQVHSQTAKLFIQFYNSKHTML
jgi:hypothetical protein